MSIPIRKTLLLSITTSTVALSTFAGNSSKSPNIIIIMADQLRADLMQREGYALNTMPFADKLAKSGAWFNKAYTAAPASGPARVCMLTGRFPNATHVRSNHNIQDAFYSKDLFDVAHEQGYTTALVGKNHSHLSKERVDFWCPYNHGGQEAKQKSEKGEAFDKYLGTLDMYSNLEPSPYGVEGQLPYRMVDDASQWIDSLDGKPFLMWFSMAEPHNPYQICEPYYSMFPPESLPPLKSSAKDRKAKGEEYELLAEMMAQGHKGFQENLPRLRSIYHGMLRMIDDQLARLVDELKKQNIYDNTIILFIADHGDYAGEYGLMKKGVGLDDAITRIPMQWTGPGIKASTLPQEAHVSIVDIFPTICEIMDAEIPIGVQGRSLWPMLQGKEYPKEEFASVMAEDGFGGMYYTKADATDYQKEGAVGKQGLFFDELNTWTQSGTMRMLRKDDWKLVYDMDGNGWLYNLKQDPSEVNNRFNDPSCKETRNEMIEGLLRWDISSQDPLPVPRHRYRFKRNEHNYLFR
ncbi:sulfatase-like hydrolase/transferase [uncultured Parabacteroides sp.]|uniref:sulfatase family protein n=1 Tax=uncultured Parabacteroides sp. TaxID=512312 RepID=UPI00258E3ECA|nr:sulfatase-like hydrolase/transferase [uncultured Parabacteroides sp.]